MSNSTKTHNALAVFQQPNHLASEAEKKAVGAHIPRHIARKYELLQKRTQQVRQALTGILPESLLLDCHVVNVSETELTVSLTSPTAVNHLRYVIMNCVQALHAYDLCFCQLQHIKVILAPDTPKLDARQNHSKRILSENTKRIIADSARFVTNDSPLQQALLRLASNND